MKSEIKAIFFDIGGVLVSVDSTRAIDQLSQLLDVTPEKIREAMTLQLLNDYEKGLLTSNQFYEAMLIKCDSKNQMSLEIFKKHWQDVLFPKTESIAFLQRVAQAYPTWLLSNTNDFHYELLMQDFPFMQWVEGGTYSFMEGSIKPEPHIYEQAISKSGFRPAEILFIDDLSANIMAARNLGIQVIQFHDFEQFSGELMADYPEIGVFL